MMRRLILIAPVLALGACATAPAERPLPPVAVMGPVFPASQFDLPAPPVPPDPATAGARASSGAAAYEDALRRADRVCRAQLGSLGRQLGAAGQVVPLKGGVR